MPTEVLVALIVNIPTLIGVIVTNFVTIKKTRIEQNPKLKAFNEEQRKTMSALQDAFAEHRVIVEMRLKNIEEKQDKYNNVIERTYKNELDIAVLKERSEK